MSSKKSPAVASAPDAALFAIMPSIVATSSEEDASKQDTAPELGRFDNVGNRLLGGEPFAFENGFNNDWEIIPNIGDDELNLLGHSTPVSPPVSPLAALSSSIVKATPRGSIPNAEWSSVRAPSIELIAKAAPRAPKPRAQPSVRVPAKAKAPPAPRQDAVWSSSPYHRFVQRNQPAIDVSSASKSSSLLPPGVNVDHASHRLLGLPPVPAPPNNPSFANKRKFQRWSYEEDQALKIAVQRENGPAINWKKIAARYFANERTGTQCKSRYSKVRKSC